MALKVKRIKGIGDIAGDSLTLKKLDKVLSVRKKKVAPFKSKTAPSRVL